MDEADYGSEREQAMLQAALDEFQYQLTHAVNAYPVGECRNCAEKLDDGRAFCDDSCRTDWDDRMKAHKRNGKYRGG